MEWYNILSIILGSGGFISVFISIYTAKSQKNSIDAETFKKFFDESQERYNEELKRNREEIELAKKEREEAKRSSEVYRKANDEKVALMEKKMDNFELRMNIKMRAINAAQRCRKWEKRDDCPVINTYEMEMRKEKINQ